MFFFWHVGTFKYLLNSFVVNFKGTKQSDLQHKVNSLIILLDGRCFLLVTRLFNIFNTINNDFAMVNLYL